MGTLRQKRLAEALIENQKKAVPANKGELLVSVGYPLSTATTYPGQVLEQKGVKEELALLGFSEDKAKEVVGQILSDDTIAPKSRLTAADMVFKVHGSYASDKLKPETPNQIVINIIGDPEIRQLSEQMDKALIKNIYEGKIIDTPESDSE